MPSGLIEDENGVRARRDSCGDFFKMQGHRLGVARRQDEGCALAVLRTDRAENIRRSGSLIARRRGPRAAFRLTPGDLVLLADPCFVSKPDLYALARRLAGCDLRQAVGEVFLKATAASGFCA